MLLIYRESGISQLISIKIRIFAKFLRKKPSRAADPLNGFYSYLVNPLNLVSGDWQGDVLVIMVVDLAANAFWQFQISWHAVNVDHPLVQGQVLVVEDFLELGFQLG